MSEPINNKPPIQDFQSGQMSRTESVELPPIIDTGKKRDVKYIRSTALMLLMFCAGLGWVYFEGRQGTSKMSKDTRISTVNTALTAMKINALTGDARTKQHESLISPLEFQPTQCQVPADDLVFNPFEIYLYRIEVKEQAEKPKEEPKVVEVKAPSLKGKTLESVLLGGRPAAMINSRTYYVGQKLNGWKIQEIKPNRVILRWKNKTHVLKMD